MKTEYFDCACYSPEHTLRFILDDADVECPENVDLILEVFLNDYQSFWKRCWIAVKYVFGYKCRGGHWDCALFRAEDVDRLMEILYRYKHLKNSGVLDG